MMHTEKIDKSGERERERQIERERERERERRGKRGMERERERGALLLCICFTCQIYQFKTQMRCGTFGVETWLSTLGTVSHVARMITLMSVLSH